jgi:DNA-binding response OmpR family regulator
MISILLLEDDVVMATQIKQFLDNQQFHCKVMRSGEAFLSSSTKLNAPFNL